MKDLIKNQESISLLIFIVNEAGKEEFPQMKTAYKHKE
jgi:hypothetical protein